MSAFKALGICGVPMVMLAGCFNTASCQLDQVTMNPDVFFINGQIDAGYVVNVLAQRKGNAGTLVIDTTLSSTEGDVTKRRTVYFNEDEAQVVSFEFPEPTITAQQVTASARCTAT